MKKLLFHTFEYIIIIKLKFILVANYLKIKRGKKVKVLNEKEKKCFNDFLLRCYIQYDINYPLILFEKGGKNNNYCY